VQTSHQRRRLLKDMESEPFHSWVILTKCRGGFADLVLIAVNGASEGDGREAVARANDGAPHTAPPAQQRRREVFDERRARYGNGDRQNGSKFEICRFTQGSASRVAFICEIGAHDLQLHAKGVSSGGAKILSFFVWNQSLLFLPQSGTARTSRGVRTPLLLRMSSAFPSFWNWATSRLCVNGMPSAATRSR